jgi:tetratricopeptide (TPR) repeat protein
MSAREGLQSWKEIAAYLGRDVRTCRRWELELGLPVHRLDGSPKARVVAYQDEIDWWLDTKLHEHDPARPNGPRPSAPRPEARSASPVLSLFRRWYVISLFAGLFVLGVLGWRTINYGRPRFVPNGSRPAIAVLPVVNATGDDGLDYLRESFPDHLILDLQHSSEHLVVYSFDAVADAVRKIGLEPGFPLSPDDLAAISSRTGAGWFLISYVSRSGSKLRFDYEVREAGAVQPLKAGRLSGSEADLAVLEGRVADGVRRAFGVPTSVGPEVVASCSVQATRFYEMARALEREYVLSPSPPELDKIIGLFDQARQADPGCPLASLGLGDAYQLRFVYEGLDPEALRLMEESYRRAYAIAPDGAETNVGLAWVQYFKRDNDQAYACLKKAMAIDPKSLHVLADVGAFLRSIGLLESAAEHFTRVLQAGGTTADIFLIRGYTYEQMGLLGSALADYDRMIDLKPGDFQSHCHRARVLILMKRFDAAAAELTVAETLAKGEPYIGLVRGLAAAARGDREAALAALTPAGPAGPPAKGTYFRSRILAALGQNNEAIAAIEAGIARGFDETHDYLYAFPVLNNTRDYFYDKLRSDPRFVEILRREERKYTEYLEKYNGL